MSDNLSRAPQPTITKWEYMVVVQSTMKAALTASGDAANTQKKLNELGAQGWELVAIGTKGYYLKRPVRY